MGLAIPQVITPSKASGAQVIDGSLKFDNSKKNHLEKDFSSDGNRRTWTWSCWVKKPQDEGFSEDGVLFEARIDSPGSTDANIFGIRWRSNGRIGVYDTGNFYVSGTREFRDTSAFYHLVLSVDTTQASNNISLYVNGDLYSQGSYTQNSDTRVNNSAATHRIGARTTVGSQDGLFLSSQLSQTYFIDGQALGPEYFGFTDPLTNTWKPKKFSGNFTQLSANDGTTWSSSVSGPVNSSKPLSLLFGGTIGSGYQNGTTPTSGNTLTFDISSKNLTVTNVRLNTFISTGPGGGGTPNTFTLNGTTVPIADSDGDQTHVVAVNGQLNTIAWSYDSGNGPYVYMRGIEVDLGGGLGYELLTDGVNNTGANSFYLPFDGNSPIGQDQSGNGNGFTPVNFGGSVELDSPLVTGARPILNTTQGGTQAGVGVFGSKQNVGYAVTVYNDGGGNKYYIDGVKQDTVTGLIRGATYTFDTSDSTVSSHPFRFSATSNGSHGGGSEYTNGVAAITGAATTITVPHDAPNTLYYYCTSHSGMGADITGITTNEKLADQYASNCILAFPMLSNSDDSVSVACTSSTKAVTNSNVTRNGISHFYGGSSLFNSSSDYYRLASSPFDYGNGDFTMEFWCYLEGAFDTARHVISAWNSSGGAGQESFYLGTGGANGYWASFGVRVDGTQYEVNGDTNKGRISQKGWHHIAGVRDGTNIRMFVDGVLIGTTAVGSGSITTPPTYVYVGKHYSASGYEWEGNLSDVRIYKGVAKYTSNFVPASTSPDILPDTPSGVSGGSKLTKITDGAVSFDGTNDYLTISDSDDFNLGSGAFTIEGFCYLRTSSAQQFLVGMWTGNQLSYAVQTSNDANRYLRFLISDDGTGVDFDKVSTGSLRLKGWSHFAVTRSGNTFYLFVDGILVGTQSGSQTLHNSTGTLAIGARNDGTQDLNGFISNVRIVKGTALYTKNFTPPTAPLTNVTNTKLLTCQSTSFYAAVAPLVSGVNNGTVWSSSLTGDSLFRSGYPAVDAFNGVTKTSTEDCAATPQVAGQGFTFLFGGGVPFTTLQMQCDHNNGTTVTANGVNITSQLSSGSLTNTTITGVTSPLTSLSVVSHNGDAGYLGSVTIDGTMLVDPFVPNGDAAATNFNPFNTDINTVRGQETGYATLNPLIPGAATLTEGNLTATSPSGHGAGRSTLTMDTSGTGKFYFEATLALVVGNYAHIGVLDPAAKSSDAFYVGNRTNCFSYRSDGKKQLEGTTASTYGDSFTTGDTIGCSLDCGSGELRFYKNGVDQGVAKTITANYHACFAASNNGSNGQWKVNFGQKPFKFPPPDGFQPLNTANTRPETVISRPDQFVGVTTYTGSGETVSPRTIELPHAADLVWAKSRDRGSSHQIADTVRGNNSVIRSNTNSSAANPTTQFNGGGISIIDGKTISLVKGSTNQANNENLNATGQTAVVWSWKAGGSKNTFNVDDVGYASAAAAGLDGGSINPSGASVGTEQGFSIVKFDSGSSGVKTLSHGLLETPTFALVKTTGANSDWSVYHKDIGGVNNYLVLNADTANATATEIWGSSLWTSSVFGINSGTTCATNQDVIAYLWHDVPGLQKFGTYEGNNNSNGPFVELGFNPAIIWTKGVDSDSHGWEVHYNRGPKLRENPQSERLMLNESATIASTNHVDFLSSGFKIRNTFSGMNSTTDTYIYCAWADVPTVDLYGGGANAR